MPVRSTTLLCGALLLTACASSAGSRVTTESAGDVATVNAAAPVVIQVTSQFPAPLAIYFVSAGVATRLGDVPAGRVEQIRLPAIAIPGNGLSLMAVPQAGDARARSGVLRVAPGSVVDFAIGASLADAHAEVRAP